MPASVICCTSGSPADAAIPMLVVRGELSDILASACVARMQSLSPTLRAVDVPDRGHAPMLDEPLAVAAIEQFLVDVVSC